MSEVHFVPTEPAPMPADEILDLFTMPESYLQLAKPLVIHAGDRIQFALLKGTGIIVGVAHYPSVNCQ